MKTKDAAMAAWTATELSLTKLTACGVILSLLVSDHLSRHTPAYIIPPARLTSRKLPSGWHEPGAF